MCGVWRPFSSYRCSVQRILACAIGLASLYERNTSELQPRNNKRPTVVNWIETKEMLDRVDCSCFNSAQFLTLPTNIGTVLGMFSVNCKGFQSKIVTNSR